MTLKPMPPGNLARLMSRRSIGSYLEQRRNERRADASRLGVALALVIAVRAGNDWAWLDQDRALHQP
jgi:hypothetical protein